MNRTKFKNLIYEIDKEISLKKWPAHHQLPSNRDLAKRFEVTVVVLRKAIDALVENGVLYKKERQGVFVAPKVKVGQILIVTGNWVDHDFAQFFSGFIDEANKDNMGIIPIHINFEEFQEHIHDIELVYRGILFVVFYRAWAKIGNALEILLEKSIPTCFYGSDQVTSKKKDLNYFVYTEATISALITQRLAALKSKKCALFYSEMPTVISRRVSAFKKALKSSGFTSPKELDYSVKTESEIKKDSPEFKAWLLRVVAAKALLYCPNTVTAFSVIQLAYSLGFKIPGDFKLIAVDNHPFCAYLPVGLTTVNIPVYEDATRLFHAMISQIRGEAHPFYLESKVSLIIRESA